MLNNERLPRVAAMTGDFDAVMQVSGGTIGRLLATMHQAGVTDGTGPRVPHVANFRIGRASEPEMPSGSVAAQIGVPRPFLVDGSRDRFRVEVGFRARYRADPDSVPLADVIHGTVHAEYRLEKIDEDCHGWKGIADDYRWLRVLRDTVRFKGVAYNDNSDLIAVEPLDLALVKRLVDAQLADLLATRFEPGPQPLGEMFRRFRCLSSGNGPNDSAIAIPVGLDGGTPSGSLSSLADRFLGGHDFGVAVDAGYVIGRVQDQVGPLAGIQRDFHIHGDAGVGGGLEIDYHVRIDSAQATWLGADSSPDRGLVRIAIAGGGWATRLYKSGVFDLVGVTIADLRMSFAVEQVLQLGFDPYGERVVISPLGQPTVSVSYGGPFASQIRGNAEGVLSSQVQNALGSSLGQAQQQLDALTSPARKAALLEQLRRIDPAASLSFAEAEFSDEGVVVRGPIGLSRRRRPRAKFRMADGRDGFDAIESWIPGGQVETFEWAWRFHASPVQISIPPPGGANEDDDFMLRRPHEGVSKFGLFNVKTKPLPGLDGNGSLCLKIHGSVVSSRTGELVPVESERECEQFGYGFHVPVEVAPWWPIYDPWLEPGMEAPFPEIGIQQPGGLDPEWPAFNTLVLALPEWDGEMIEVLLEGLDRCRRVGSGLLVSLLFPEGLLVDPGAGLGGKLEELAAKLPAPMQAVENVGGAWSESLALTDESLAAWRLIAPGGGLAWVRDGLPDSDEGLARVLEKRLVSSPPPLPVPIGPSAAIGKLLPIELLFPPCPPVPLSRPGLGGSKLIFVQHAHELSLAELQKFGSEEEGREGKVLAAGVVAGADAEAVETLRAELGLELPLFPDPDGRMTREAGVRFSPARLGFDEDGRLADVRVGIVREERA